MMIDVEDNVPAPIKKTWVKRYFPLDEMKIGQSILVPIDAVYAARMACRRHSEKKETEWTTKVTDGGMRIWRLK
jgi:hypothetical protein